MRIISFFIQVVIFINQIRISEQLLATIKKDKFIGTYKRGRGGRGGASRMWSSLESWCNSLHKRYDQCETPENFNISPIVLVFLGK